jgi:dTDP-4-amino-4,6-dideoxygalactose transaminase
MVHRWPRVTEADRAAVAAALSGDDLSGQQRQQSEALETAWARYVGVRYCVATNSGTSALHMALAGVGLEPGDEVIVPAFTFWATAAAVLHHNGIPVFVDIEPRTFCIDPARIAEKIGPRTRAIMPVHIHGMPVEMDPILTLAHRHGLPVIEDACQAHGALYRDRKVGSLGAAAGFSTQMSKPLTTGSEGGLFVTNNEQIFRRAVLLHNFGELFVPGRERNEREYNAYGLGWMYRGDVLGQAFARSQLERLDANNAARRLNCKYLTKLLRDVPGVETPVEPAERRTVFYDYVVGLRPDALGLDVEPVRFRDKIQQALQAEGVRTGLWQRLPVPHQQIFQDRVGYGRGCPWSCRETSTVSYDIGDYPHSERFLASHLYVFGINPPNGRELMERYVEAFRKVLQNAETLLA